MAALARVRFVTDIGELAEAAPVRFRRPVMAVVEEAATALAAEQPRLDHA
jgi:hypothetical protein